MFLFIFLRIILFSIFSQCKIGKNLWRCGKLGCGVSYEDVECIIKKIVKVTQILGIINIIFKRKLINLLDLKHTMH